jgi:hypothetical protein
MDTTNILPIDQSPHLHVELHVKFRIFFTDVGKFDLVQNIPLPLPGAFVTSHHDLLAISQRGVTLGLSLLPPAAPAPAFAPLVKVKPAFDINGNAWGTNYTKDENGQDVKVPPADPAPLVVLAGG